MSNSIKIINIKHLTHNLKTIRKQIGSKTKLCAVVKDNAYGHGIENIIKTTNEYANYYAVANIKEAKQLRELTTLPILILGEFDIECLDDVIKFDLDVTISSLKTLTKLNNLKIKHNINIHLAIDCGMHRLGFFNKREFKQAIKLIENNKNLTLAGVFSHLGEATSNERSQKQNRIFNEYLTLIPSTMHPIIHLSNSASTFKNGAMHFDMVRVGIGLFGYGNKNLKPVMSVYAKIVHSINIKTDDYVGYGMKHKAKKGTKIAVISIGYGNGYMRSNERFGYVIINGKLCKIIANVCMDMILVNATGVNFKIGNYATIMGKNKGHEIDAEQLATFNNTICYEILTNFNLIKNSRVIN